MSYLVELPWDSQPQEVAELRGDGAIPLPTILWIGSQPHKELASGLAVARGAAVTDIVGPPGRAVRTAASATGFITLGAAADVSPTGAFTLACLVKQDATVNAFAVSTRTGSVADGFEFLIGNSGVVGTMAARFDAASAVSSSVKSGLNDGQYHIALMGRNTDNTLWFWVDGVAVNDNYATVSGTSASGQPLSLARRGTTYADNSIALVGYWDGVSFDAAQRKAFSDGPWAELFAPRKILIPVAATGTPTLSPSLLTNTNSFFSPTVSPGSVSLSPSLLTNSSTLYAPSAAIGAVTLSPPLLASGTTLYVPSITPGAVALFPPLLTNSSSIYSATVSIGALTVFPPLVTNTNSFYAATVIPGSVFVAPPLLASTATLYAPTVGSSYALAPSLLSNGNSFYALSVTPGSVTLAPSLLASVATVFAPVVGLGSVALLPPLVTNTTVFHGPLVTGGASLLSPSLVTNVSVFYGPTIVGGAVALVPPLLTNISLFPTLFVTRSQKYLTGAFIPSTNAFYAGAVSSSVAPVTFDKIKVWNGTAWISLIREQVDTAILDISRSETAAVVVGTNKYKMMVTHDMRLKSIPVASLSVPQSSGSTFTMDIKYAGISILSTLLTIDNTEPSSLTAAIQAVLLTTDFSRGQELSVDVTQIGVGDAAGLKLYLRSILVPNSTLFSDPYFVNVSLLLHMNGTDASTTFLDNSANVFTVTAVGEAKLATAAKKYGSASGVFDGVSDYLTIPDNVALRMGTSEFTIEFWVQFNTLGSYVTLVNKGYTAAGGLLIQTTITNGRMNVYFGATAVAVEATGTINTAQWYHIAVTRNVANLVTVWRDGASVASGTNATDLNNTSVLAFCGGSNTGFNNFWLNGNLDDVRITKGVCRYTNTFVPPVAQFFDL